MGTTSTPATRTEFSAATGALWLIGAAPGIDVLVPWLPVDLPRVESIGLHLPLLAVAAVTLAGIAVSVAVWPELERSR